MLWTSVADKCAAPIDRSPCPLHARPPQCRPCAGQRKLRTNAAYRPQLYHQFTQQPVFRQRTSILLRRQGKDRGALQRVRCDGEGSDDDEKTNNGGRPPPKRSRKPLAWLREVLGSVRSQKSLRIIFNVAGLLLLMRFWPLNGRNPLTGDSANVSVEVGASTLRACYSQDYCMLVSSFLCLVLGTLRTLC